FGEEAIGTNEIDPDLQLGRSHAGLSHGRCSLHGADYRTRGLRGHYCSRSTAASAIAIASISILASCDYSERTSPLVSAGYGGVKCRPRNSTMRLKWLMSVRKIVTFTTLRRLEPPARSARSRFSKA